MYSILTSWAKSRVLYPPKALKLFANQQAKRFQKASYEHFCRRTIPDKTTASGNNTKPRHLE